MSARPETSRTRYVSVEGTTWPVNVGEEGWRLRYAPDAISPKFVASIVSAYAYLTDPSLTQKDAIAALKRARTAATLAPFSETDTA